jgi:hypothetical protein
MPRSGGGAKEPREGAKACDFSSLADGFAYSIARQKMIE